MRSYLPVVLASVLALPVLAQGDGQQAPASDEFAPYFGQPVPGLTPESFAPGIVNTPAIELNGVFSPDGREFFFTRKVAGVEMMLQSVYADGRWSEPVRFAAFPGELSADMAVSPDGQSLYFLGQHTNEYAPEKPSLDVWVSRRDDGAWAPARVVPPPVSTDAMDIYPVVVADGSLYFTSNRPGGIGPNDLYRAQRLPDGRFAEPVNVGPPINGSFGTGDTFVAPDESYMIFSSRRPPSVGNGDLFVAFRLEDGRWGEPIHLGEVVNSAEHEFCPMVTPDGRYLFFSRLYGGSWAKATGGDIFWIDVKFLDRFRP